MSAETLSWLNQNVLIGFADKRGKAWHYDEASQGDQPNHYAGAIPVADVIKRLFYWEPVEGKVKTEIKVGGRRRTVPVPGKKSLAHPDTGDVFSIVGEGFNAHSYRQWLVDNFRLVLDTDDLGIGSAGLLKLGGEAWVQLELPESVQGPGGIVHRPFLTGSAVLTGRRSTSYSTGSTVAVCDNTLSAALASALAMIKYTHHAGTEMKPQQVREALDMLIGSADTINAELDALLSMKVNDTQWDKYIEAHIGKPRPFEAGRGQTNWDTTHDQLTELYRNDPMVAPWNGTGFGVLQAASTWRHHHQVVKNVTGGRAERNLLNRVNGTNDREDVATLARIKMVLAA